MALAAAALICGGSVFANEVFSADTFLIDAAVQPAVPDAAGVQVQRVRPVPENPQPLPIPADVVRPNVDKGVLVSFDLTSRTEFVSDSSDIDGELPPSDQTEDGTGGGIPEPSTTSGGMSILNFSSLSRVYNQTDFPYCATVKLYMKFANGVWYVASGALVDPTHVLTAGHCVYDATNEAGGGWATEMIVVPAYSEPDKPFGEANSWRLHSWSGWTVSASFDHDIGLISLERPVGALTGWYGYGYNDDPSFYKTTQFENPGYPAASPYNGLYMYTWSGTFSGTETIGKNWYGNEVYVSKQAYGGQSGSNAFTTSGSTRTTYAILSNGNVSRTNFPRITSDKFADLRDIYIGNEVPSAFDLIPLNVTAEPDTIVADTALTAFSCLIHNYSSATWNGTVTIKVYLSTDNVITTADTLIHTHGLTTQLGPLSSVRANFNPPPAIPVGTSGGYRYLGVILDIADDDPANNKTTTWDTKRITVVQVLNAPTGVTAGNGTSTASVTVTWNAVSGASHYRVSRAETVDGVKTVVANWQTATSFSDTSATPGKLYYYWVQAAENSSGYRASAYSAVASGWRAFMPPQNVQAGDGLRVDGILVSWDPSPFAAFYRVYRAAGAQPMEAIGAWQAGTSFDDTTAAAGFTYTYWITAAADASGVRESGLSASDTGWLRVVHTLSVTSAPVAGFSIGGSRQGVTEYTATCDDSETVNLCAPVLSNIGGIEYIFIRWRLDGADQPHAQTNLTLVMNAARAAEMKATVYGDVNDDCQVNILDLILVRNLLGQPTETGDNWRADLNSDGRINILDMILVRNRLGVHCPN